MLAAIVIGFFLLSAWVVLTARQRMKFLQVLEEVEETRSAVMEFGERALGESSIDGQLDLLSRAVQKSLGAPGVVALFNHPDSRSWLARGVDGERVELESEMSQALARFTSDNRDHVIFAGDSDKFVQTLLGNLGSDAALILPAHARAPRALALRLGRAPSELDRELMEEAFSGVLTAFATAEGHKSIEPFIHRSGRDMVPAAQPHRAILASRPAPEWLDVSCSATQDSLAANENGSWWSAYASDTSCLLLLGQAAASGAAGTLLNSAVRAFCDRLMNRASATMDPSVLVTELNTFLFRPTHPVGTALTAVHVDRKNGRVTMAGSTAMLYVYGTKKAAPAVVGCKGPVLGLDARATFPESKPIALEKGGRLVSICRSPAVQKELVRPAILQKELAAPSLDARGTLAPLLDTELGNDSAVLALKVLK